MKKSFWRLFAETGNIKAYLVYKKAEDLTKDGEG